MIENTPQHLFIDETFGSAHVRKQDISYFFPAAPAELQAIRDFLDFERWAGLTPEEKHRVYDLLQLEISRRESK